MYTSKKFRVRDIDEVKDEIKAMAPYSDQVKKIFLADGNAMALPFNYLVDLLRELHKAFPKLLRVSAYAIAKDLIAKTDEELKALFEAGLKLIYLGIESGDDEILQMVRKGETKASTIQGLQKAKTAGIKSSVMILLGLGGRKHSHQHAINSAKVVNATQPEYVSTLVLSYPNGLDHFIKRFKGDFEPCEVPDLLKELKTFLSHTELDQSIFRSDHASNYLIIKGTLGREKERMIKEIDAALQDPGGTGLRPEWMRGL